MICLTPVCVFLDVVAKTDTMPRHPLPKLKRTKQEGEVIGRASQAFNVQQEDSDGRYPGYISGHLELPPKGIKDPEPIGECTAIFTVISCQPQAVEVSFADPRENDGEWDSETAQRFLMNPGDFFRVKPGNIYRLQNYSKDTNCLMVWHIIRPNEG